MGEPGGPEEDPPPPKPEQTPAGAPPAPAEPPLQPESPFVSRLRMEVAVNRTPSNTGIVWGLQPSVGSWLTPRGRRAAADAGQGAAEGAGGGGAGSSSGSQAPGVRRVSFAQDEDACVLPPLVCPVARQQPEESPPAAPSEKLELRVKGSAAKPFSLEDVDSHTTIAQFKALCQPHVNLAPEQQRLLHKGKILQDQQTLAGAGIPNKGTVFLVKAQAKKVEEEQPPPKAPAPVVDKGPVGPPCIECGVNVGRAQTNGLCSICWREQVVKENKEMKKRREQAKKREEEAVREALEKQRREEEAELRKQQDTTRCYCCRKKIGLTGFLCQCGYYFCATHRHAEDHGCTFDHRARGRDILCQQVGGATPGPTSSDSAPR